MNTSTSDKYRRTVACEANSQNYRGHNNRGAGQLGSLQKYSNVKLQRPAENLVSPPNLSIFLRFMRAFSFPCFTNMAEMSGFNVSLASNSHQLPGVSHPKTSWERRCLRKHRRRADDEGCSAKRRRLMGGGGACSPGQSSCPSVCQNWTPVPDYPLSEPPTSVPPHACQGPQSRQEMEGSCMEVEAAQRRLQEIEERITLEDDDEDEDLDVEPTPRRPMLVMSDSLREGLQRGITDILPHKVARSVSHSCMELVVWRPPEDALSQRLKDSLQKQRKQQQQQQQTASRQAPRPSPSLHPHSPLSSTGPAHTHPPPFCNAAAQSSGEEDMEL